MPGSDLLEDLAYSNPIGKNFTASGYAKRSEFIMSNLSPPSKMTSDFIFSRTFWILDAIVTILLLMNLTNPVRVLFYLGLAEVGPLSVTLQSVRPTPSSRLVFVLVLLNVGFLWLKGLSSLSTIYAFNISYVALFSASRLFLIVKKAHFQGQPFS